MDSSLIPLQEKYRYDATLLYTDRTVCACGYQKLCDLQQTEFKILHYVLLELL